MLRYISEFIKIIIFTIESAEIEKPHVIVSPDSDDKSREI